MSQLLSTDASARLVCLEFPTFKEPHTGGPPFGLRPEVYVAHLGHPGERLPYTDAGYPNEANEGVPEDGKLERIAHWQPERTHSVGQGTDWIGIWRH